MNKLTKIYKINKNKNKNKKEIKKKKYINLLFYI